VTERIDTSTLDRPHELGAREKSILLKTLGQIDLVHRMVKKYPDVFELAATADDVERLLDGAVLVALVDTDAIYPESAITVSVLQLPQSPEQVAGNLDIFPFALNGTNIRTVTPGVRECFKLYVVIQRLDAERDIDDIRAWICFQVE
jgi:hypothetical protein